MTVAGSDIVFTLSGGSTNTNPNLSLGGDPSPQPIIANTLFDDLTQSHTTTGRTDYRCLYMFNDNTTHTFYNVTIAIANEGGGTTLQLGFNIQNDLQVITVNGVASGGNFVIDYNSTFATATYDANPTTWATNLQAALNALPTLGGVLVTASTPGSSTVFTISFQGINASRYQPTLHLVSNNLIGLPPITFAKLVAGSPINTIAPLTDAATTPPTGITFAATPVTIGNMLPLDGVPVWIKRTCAAGSPPVTNDGLAISVSGSPMS